MIWRCDEVVPRRLGRECRGIDIERRLETAELGDGLWLQTTIDAAEKRKASLALSAA